MSSTSTSAYDLIPFQGKPSPERAPDTFHVLARLFGLSAPPAKSFSLVELGCGSGSALIPLAIAYPEASFVGIDSAAGQIEQGQQLIKELQLENIELWCEGVENVQPGSKQFDYLVCHGVLSWVQEGIQASILSLCKTLLKEDGICYLSYNTLPGWATRGEVRGRLIAEIDQEKTLVERVKAARKILEGWEFDLRQDFSNKAMKLKEELRVCIQQSDGFILHELLAPISKPFFVGEFARLAGEHDLVFFAEALPSRMFFSLMSDDSEEFDRVEAEQEIDHHSNISFRGSVLCKAPKAPASFPTSSVIGTFYVSSTLVPKIEIPDIHSNSVQAFVAPDDIEFNEQIPIVKAALVYLRGLWPEPLPFQEVYEAARGLVAHGEESEEEEQMLKDAMLRLFFKGVVFFNTDSGEFTRRISKNPRVSPFAMAQARSSWWVTTLRNEYLYIDQFQRHLIQYVDGTHSIEDLNAEMLQLVQQDMLTPKEDGQEIKDVEQLENAVVESVQVALTIFAEYALLLRDA